MIDLLCMVAGGYIGGKLGDRIGDGKEKPLWHWALNPRTELLLVRTKWRGTTYFRVYAITNGDTAMVAQETLQARVFAVIQTWQNYLSDGGTVDAWRVSNAVRGQEITVLNEQWNQPGAKRRDTSSRAKG